MPAWRAPAVAQPAHTPCTTNMRVQYPRQTQAPTAAGRGRHKKGGRTCAKDVLLIIGSIRGRTRGVRVKVSAGVARIAQETRGVAARRAEAVFHRVHRAADKTREADTTKEADTTREAQRRVGGLDGGGAVPRTRDLLLALDAY